MGRNIYFITGSDGKFAEAKAHIPTLKRKRLDLPEIQSLNPEEVIRAKLEAAGEEDNYGTAIIVEDTSLVLECLNGLPGPLIKWFLEAVGCMGLYRIAGAMNDMRATAITVIGYRDSEGCTEFFRGKVEGRIVIPRGNKNFSWDVVFQPDGYSQTFAEMTPEEKNAISHRHIALEKLAKHLNGS